MGSKTSKKNKGDNVTLNAGHSLDYKTSKFKDVVASLPPPKPLEGTGGTTYTPGNGYKYHKFLVGNTDNFVVSSPGVCEILVVAGGGSGGNYYGGGGGAGGVAHGVDINLSNGTYPVSVGAGGNSPGAGTHSGNQGSNSYFGAPGTPIGSQPDHILAKGGGAGGSSYQSANGGSGGCGGGDPGGNSPPYGGLATQPGTNPSPQVTDHGFPGGWSYPTGGYAPAGGGGAGVQGANITQNVPGGGAGGDGIQISGFEYPLIGASPFNPYSPTNNHYGGGGGAGIYSTPVAPNRDGSAGYGGGGAANAGNSGNPGINGLGGGGAGSHPGPSGTPGAGGSGVVVVRYAV